mgnify:CR=1 FL=1
MQMLEKIFEETAVRVAQDKQQYPLAKIENERLFAEPERLEESFRPGEINIISEIKYGSPSKGRIFDPQVIAPVEVANQYVANGAKALSILTEPKYFLGSYEYLMDARRANPRIPILMKDFYFDPYQIYFARYIGANIALLLVRYLDEVQLRDFHDLATELGMSALVEVHDERELETAIKIGAKVIGVNNRNLDTLKVDLETARSLYRQIPDGVIKICESGIYQRAEIDAFRDIGYDGFLIGTSLMQDGHPGQALKALIKG